jgi:hypothetical protein|tara:strand:- start:9469 stop:9804 length:336 start_codon:yes stop_codon:yes gene_type:complete
VDPRLKTVLDDVDHINTINNQKRLAKEKFYEGIVIFYNGGKFTINTAFVSFISTIDATFITDDNDVPVKIENINDFRKLVTTTYFAETEKYFNEYSKLISSSKDVEDLLSV